MPSKGWGMLRTTWTLCARNCSLWITARLKQLPWRCRCGIRWPWRTRNWDKNWDGRRCAKCAALQLGQQHALENHHGCSLRNKSRMDDSLIYIDPDLVRGFCSHVWPGESARLLQLFQRIMVPRTFRWVDLGVRDPQLPEALPKADRWAHGFAHAYTRHWWKGYQRKTCPDWFQKLKFIAFFSSTIFWMIGWDDKYFLGWINTNQLLIRGTSNYRVEPVDCRPLWAQNLRDAGWKLPHSRFII